MSIPPPARKTSRKKLAGKSGGQVVPSALGATSSADNISPSKSQPLRKPVNTLAIVPKSVRITSLARKSYNVLLYEAQDQGLEKEVFRIPLDRVVKGVDFDSNDHALIKKHLRAMVSTTVEWQSPTTGEGMAWNVSGLLAHARLLKERGQVWVEWSYAVNLKQELLEPTVFARLKLEIISQLRSHAGIALYEICTRYKDIGRTARQHWRWWQPVLSGQPVSERSSKQEYRIFKRDTLKPAIAEVSAITDLEVELAEYKEGRFISEIQFLIRPKRQTALPLKTSPEPVDLSLIQAAVRLGIEADKAEDLQHEFGLPALRASLEALSARQQHDYPAPVRDPYRYLRSLLTQPADSQTPTSTLLESDVAAAPSSARRISSSGERVAPGRPQPPSPREGHESPARSTLPARQAALEWPAAKAPVGPVAQPAMQALAEVMPNLAAKPMPVAAPQPVAQVAEPPADFQAQAAPTVSRLAAETRDSNSRRPARWMEEWLRRRREQFRLELLSLSSEEQAGWMSRLMDNMAERKVHPSLQKRLQSHGWQHPLVLQEMLRFFGQQTYGEHWDQAPTDQLLRVAAELGEMPVEMSGPTPQDTLG